MDKIVDSQSRIVTLSYLAGLFDGEGCACISKQKSDSSLAGFRYRSWLDVRMTDYEPVKLFHETFSGSFWVINERPPRKTQYGWRIRGWPAAQVASQLILFSHNLRKKAALKCIIDFGKTISKDAPDCKGVSPEIQQSRESLCNRCHALNAKGSSANNRSAAELQAIQDLQPETAQLRLWNE